jgi:hypothetical protein
MPLLILGVKQVTETVTFNEYIIRSVHVTLFMSDVSNDNLGEWARALPSSMGYVWSRSSE